MKNPRLNLAIIGSCFVLLTFGWFLPSEGGNVTFVRRSTGNWHRLGETTLIVRMDYWALNDGVDSDIDDGLPSVIAPLADGGDQEVDVEYPQLLQQGRSQQRTRALCLALMITNL
ncbi:MAG: hypothetical protein JWP89_5091 [Schlesneria sp.]|nr:hypothetical protein [Schlesneria sp.]